MREYRVRLRLGSALGAPSLAAAFQADTFWGHWCWAVLRLGGEAGLAEFLEHYGAGMPLVVCSNGFPGVLLPRPVLPPEGRREGQSRREVMAAMGRAKEARRRELLTSEEFERALTLTLSQEGEGTRGKDGVEKHEVTLKNQLSRLTATTGEEGQLFQFEETWLEQPAEVSVYLRLEDGYEAEARRVLEVLAETGYGKRKSASYGRILEWAMEDWRPPRVEGANGFVSLSNWVPAAGDPTEGWWQSFVKYGRLGEEWATEESAFKRPLVMLRAGSCFYDASVRDWYGRLVPGVSAAHEEVVQYGLALAVPARLPEPAP